MLSSGLPSKADLLWGVCPLFGTPGCLHQERWHGMASFPAITWAQQGDQCQPLLPRAGLLQWPLSLYTWPWISQTTLKSKALYPPSSAFLTLSMGSGYPESYPFILTGTCARGPCAFLILPWFLVLRGPKLTQSSYWEHKRKKKNGVGVKLGLWVGGRMDGMLNRFFILESQHIMSTCL